MPAARKKGTKKGQSEGQQALFDFGDETAAPDAAPPAIKETAATYTPATLPVSPSTHEYGDEAAYRQGLGTAEGVSTEARGVQDVDRREAHQPLMWDTLSTVEDHAPALSAEPPHVAAIQTEESPHWMVKPTAAPLTLAIESAQTEANTFGPVTEVGLLAAFAVAADVAAPMNEATLDQQLAEATLAEINRARAAGEPGLAWETLDLPPFDEADPDAWLIRLEYLRDLSPAAYLAAALSYACRQPDDASPVPGLRTLDLVDEVRARGLALLPPDINRSRAVFGLTENGAILAGLCAVRGLSDVGCGVLADERARGGAFADIADFCRRVPFALAGSAGVDRDGLLALIWSGALDGLVVTAPALARAVLVANYERLWHAGQRTMPQPVYQPDAPPPTSAPMQLSLFDSPPAQPAPPSPAPLDLAVPPAALSPVTALRRQEAALGFDTAVHPLWRWPHVLVDDAGQIRGGWTLVGDMVTQVGSDPGTAVKVAGVAMALRHIAVGDPALTVVGLEDWTGRVDVIVAQPTPIAVGDVLAVLGTLATLDSDTPADRPTLIAYDVRVLADIADVRGVNDLRAAPPVDVNDGVESVESMAARFEAEAYARQRAALAAPPPQPAPAPPARKPQESGGHKTAKSGGYSCLFITLPALDTPDADDRLLDDIDQVLTLAPGPVPVIYLVEDTPGETHRIDPHRSVAVEEGVLAQLERLVGPPNVRPMA